MNDNNSNGAKAGPLAGLRVLDLTRILAGPTCTQLLGDMGADIIKVERPKAGDDTRKWGPPYIRDADGNETTESAYYLCANRNKRSVTIDIAQPEGAELVRRLAQNCDVLVENFKVGNLARYGLAYDDLKDALPRLVYCSITGFGQTGPYAKRAGYDFLAQGMGGMMSLTGEPDGEPMKVGVGIADVVCGFYAANAIQAALRHRDRTGEGQHIDIALADSQVAWLINEGTNYLMSGEVPKRRGNAHQNIVPYQLFPASDGYFILAVGNDAQFQRFCKVAGLDDVAEDARFTTNTDRIHNRDALIPLISAATEQKPMDFWLQELEEVGVPSGAVNTLDRVFSDPQFKERKMTISMPHHLAGNGAVDLIGNPVKFSETPVTYRLAPPVLGEHTDDVLSEQLGLSEAERERLRSNGTI